MNTTIVTDKDTEDEKARKKADDHWADVQGRDRNSKMEVENGSTRHYNNHGVCYSATSSLLVWASLFGIVFTVRGLITATPCDCASDNIENIEFYEDDYYEDDMVLEPTEVCEDASINYEVWMIVSIVVYVCSSCIAFVSSYEADVDDVWRLWTPHILQEYVYNVTQSDEYNPQTVTWEAFKFGTLDELVWENFRSAEAVESKSVKFLSVRDASPDWDKLMSFDSTITQIEFNLCLQFDTEQSQAEYDAAIKQWSREVSPEQHIIRDTVEVQKLIKSVWVTDVESASAQYYHGFWWVLASMMGLSCFMRMRLNALTTTKRFTFVKEVGYSTSFEQ